MNIALNDGTPTITWEPNSAERVYAVEGKQSISDAEWGPTNSVSRFFRVTVSVK